MNKKEILEWIKCIVISVAIALFIRTFIFNSTKVIGDSMYPTLNENDRLISFKVVYLLGEPKRGDVVVLKAPYEPNKDYIKRVIGIEGDYVEIKDGDVYVNGEKKEENYIEDGVLTETYEQEVWEIPKGYVFVLGDNRQPGASKDSRSFGLVEVDTVKGKASYRYFPFNRIGLL